MLDYALENGYDYIATGHYARIEYNKETQKYKLKKAADKSKDQSYFLYTLTQDRLRHILFPLGEYTKPQVRDAAEKRGLRNARKRDSQDICFIQNEKYSDFIRRYIENKITAGSFTDISGKILGQHTGITDYTIGQRKGLGISFESPMYVLSKNAEKNTIVLGNDKDLYTTCINAFSINFISGDYPLTPLEASAKIRYSQDEVKCLIHPVGKDEIKIEFEQPVRAAAAGQSVVFYSGEELLGGAIIK